MEECTEPGGIRVQVPFGTQHFKFLVGILVQGGLVSKFCPSGCTYRITECITVPEPEGIHRLPFVRDVEHPAIKQGNTCHRGIDRQTLVEPVGRHRGDVTVQLGQFTAKRWLIRRLEDQRDFIGLDIGNYRVQCLGKSPRCIAHGPREPRIERTVHLLCESMERTSIHSGNERDRRVNCKVRELVFIGLDSVA